MGTLLIKMGCAFTILAPLFILVIFIFFSLIGALFS
jgi:hypothetical protein